MQGFGRVRLNPASLGELSAKVLVPIQAYTVLGARDTEDGQTTVPKAGSQVRTSPSLG